MMYYLNHLSRITRAILIASLRGYQYTLSPDHGWLRVFFPAGVCRFEPTCSEYMRQALQRHGWYGVVLGIQRILRCHPFTTGGVDLVPPPIHRK